MTIQQRARSAIASLALVGLILAGCGPANPSVAPSIVPSAAPSVASSVSASGPSTPAASLPTTGRIALADKGFAITLPDGWTRIDLGPDAVKDLMDAGASALPKDMQDVLGGQVGQMAASGVALFALRQPGGNVAAGTTLNVLSLPSLGVPIDTIESLIVTQIKGVAGPDTQVTTARVQGPAGEFLRLTYDLKAGDVSIGTVQYLFAGPTKQYVISCGTPGPISAIQAECEAIATTLEIL
jgi:hypothetical protein